VGKTELFVLKEVTMPHNGRFAFMFFDTGGRRQSGFCPVMSARGIPVCESFTRVLAAVSVLAALAMFQAPAQAQTQPAGQPAPAAQQPQGKMLQIKDIKLPSASELQPDSSGLVMANGLEPDVTADVSRVLGLLKRYRGLELKTPVKATRTTALQLLEYVNRQLNKPESARQVQVVEAFFKATGSIPADTDLTGIMRSYLVEEIAGLYDWEDKTLYLAERVYGDLRTLTMSHELTHAMQDQHFGLSRFMDIREGVSEPFAAAQALMEGDATLTMLQVQTGTVPNPMVAELLVKSLFSVLDMDGRMKELKVPPVIGELLMFPYLAGFRFAVHFVSQANGKWSDIDWMFMNPPLSTEQLMHPEKMHRPDAKSSPDFPRDVVIPGAAELVTGAAFHGSDIAGEGNLAALFRHGSNPGAAAEAASGWDGDRFVVWRDKAGRHGLVIASVWDSPDDAAQAAQAFRETPVRPAAVKVSGDRVVAAWGSAVKSPEKMVSRILSDFSTREIRTWQDWFR